MDGFDRPPLPTLSAVIGYPIHGGRCRPINRMLRPAHPKFFQMHRVPITLADRTFYSVVFAIWSVTLTTWSDLVQRAREQVDPFRLVTKRVSQNTDADSWIPWSGRI